MGALLGILILIHWLEREGLKDTHDGSVSFLDVIYFTMISATTTGYGDIVPVTDRTRMFDAIVVTPIRILFLLILAGSAYAFVARRSWERSIMKRIQRTLRAHHRRRLRHQEHARREGTHRPGVRSEGHRRHRHQ